MDAATIHGHAHGHAHALVELAGGVLRKATILVLSHARCDALRARHPHEIIYTYWDYQAGEWQRDHGVRIDHLLLSPEAIDRLGAVDVDKAPRGLEKPSDHTPIWCELIF